ncbi:hypothetical protein HMPREF1979_00684 [Actinomyces johnsonii F0542]|uniref:Uncharacterized protein n=1 Tax=Actinomyces johnsonii F0542 TaxID=1321818 RepID=U1S3I8_9ACTO|nr:hypothetical protein HMPREF1979_00684 [Actinomyces johnsonii F0542]
MARPADHPDRCGAAGSTEPVVAPARTARRGAPATSGPARRRRGRLLSAHVLSNRTVPRIHSPSALSEARTTFELRYRWPEPLAYARMGA